MEKTRETMNLEEKKNNLLKIYRQYFETAFEKDMDDPEAPFSGHSIWERIVDKIEDMIRWDDEQLSESNDITNNIVNASTAGTTDEYMVARPSPELLACRNYLAEDLLELTPQETYFYLYFLSGVYGAEIKRRELGGYDNA